MSHPQPTRSRTRSVDLSAAGTALFLAATVFFALLALYLVGVDQGWCRCSAATRTCTNSCTTPGTCSASPAANGGAAAWKNA